MIRIQSEWLNNINNCVFENLNKNLLKKEYKWFKKKTSVILVIYIIHLQVI